MMLLTYSDPEQCIHCVCVCVHVYPVYMDAHKNMHVCFGESGAGYLRACMHTYIYMYVNVCVL